MLRYDGMRARPTATAEGQLLFSLSLLLIYPLGYENKRIVKYI